MKQIKCALIVFVTILLSLSPFGSGIAYASATSISTCTALQNIGSTGLNGDYILSGDIDCSGISNFSPIGTFTGTLDGQGFTISSLTVNGGFLSDQIGLFSATNGAVIRNLSITNANVQGYTRVGVLVGNATNTIITNVAVSSGTTMFGLGSSGNVGGLVGYASNTLISYSHTAIPMNVGGSNVGGLVGSATNGTIISKSYSTGQVSCTVFGGGGNVGGLVGTNDSSTIVDSYSQSFMQSGIFSVSNVGGLVGVNNGSTALINRSYAENGFNIVGTPQGLVGSQTNSASTTNSFWDTTVSGTGSSAAGTGKNTSQMQTQGTFVSGWDFTNTWVIGGYPTLRAGDVTAPATPASFTAVATGSNVHLAWTNPADVDFVSVFVRRSTTSSPSDVFSGTGVLSGSTATSYDDNSLADNTYYYTVIAIDTNGNYSIPARASVRVDTTPPSAPTSVTTSVVGSVVTVHWTNPGDADFATITIRRGTSGYPTTPTNGSPVVAGFVGTSYPDTVPADAAYYYSVFALDTTGNFSTPGQMSATVDTVLPVLAVTTPVPTYTNTATPSYTFTSTKLGALTYGGSCSSATTNLFPFPPIHTITVNALANGTYSNCTITVTDAFGNISLPLAIGTFTVDTVAPVLTAGSEVGQNVFARDAVYTFTTTETGAYTLSGCVGSVDGTAHTVTFSSLLPGTYSCTLSETDLAGNTSNTLTIQPFTIRDLPHGGRMAPIVNVVALAGSLGFTLGAPKVSSTGATEVPLTFNADPKTVQGYAISLDPSFTGAGIMPYASEATFSIPKASGSVPIYVKYYSTTGKSSEVFSQRVVYTTSAETVTTVGRVSQTKAKASPKAPVSRITKHASKRK